MQDNRGNFAGVIAPVLTPFRTDLKPDHSRFVEHCRTLLDTGCTGLAIFGTTSEGNSLSVEEKIALLNALVAAGVDARLLMPGTGLCALPETVRLTRHAVRQGCGAVLMLPPFYYKAVDDDGLFRYFSQVIDQVAESDLRIYLYHIPPVAQVGFSLALIERLVDAFPDVVVGIKDSSGDWDNTHAVLQQLPGFRAFVGTEDYLLANLESGGVGCITATGNVNAGPIRQLYDRWSDKDAADQQRALSAARATIAQYPTIPALKFILADRLRDPQWRTVRAPLEPLGAEKGKALLQDLFRKHGFESARQ